MGLPQLRHRPRSATKLSTGTRSRALLIFFSYNNLVRLSEASVKQGKVAFATGWWPLHLFALLCVAGLFAWRLNVNHPYHPLVMLSAFKRRLRKPQPLHKREEAAVE